MKRHFYLLFFVVVIITGILLAESISSEENMKNTEFKIIIWDNENNHDLETLRETDLSKLMKLYSPKIILSENLIDRYYWVGQAIKFNRKKIEKLYSRISNPFTFVDYSFSFVLDDKVLFNGIVRPYLTARGCYYNGRGVFFLVIFKSSNSVYFVVNPNTEADEDGDFFGVTKYPTEIEDIVKSKALLKHLKGQTFLSLENVSIYDIYDICGEQDINEHKK